VGVCACRRGYRNETESRDDTGRRTEVSDTVETGGWLIAVCDVGVDVSVRFLSPLLLHQPGRRSYLAVSVHGYDAVLHTGPGGRDRRVE
jgi:hypothetical protein